MKEVGLKYVQRTHVHVQYMYHIKIRNQKLGEDTVRCTDVENKGPYYVQAYSPEAFTTN